MRGLTLVTASLIVPAVMTAACAPRSIFDPAGPAARSIAGLGWLVLIAFGITTAVMWALIALAGARRRGTLDWHAPAETEGGLRWVLIGGFAIPAAVLGVVFVVMLQSMSGFPVRASAADPQIRVRGHRWWFEAQYRIGGVDQWVTTATELHVPIGQPIDIALESADVIHSFWIPRLHGKVDLVPGMTNHLRLEVDAPGRYGGQCAEYCGMQHAKMRLLVVAETPASFAAWLERQRRPAEPPASPAAERGRQLVEQTACALCHTVRGTAALGSVGPDLTHLASRSTLAGGSLPNDTARLHAWITHAQALKRGAQMPDLTRYSGAELHDLVAYLSTLK